MRRKVNECDIPISMVLQKLSRRIVCVLSCVPLCGLEPARLLCPPEFLGKDTEVGCHFLLQGIFPTQGSNLCLLHW